MLAHLDDEEALTVEAVEILLHKPIALVLDHVLVLRSPTRTSASCTVSEMRLRERSTETSRRNDASSGSATTSCTICWQPCRARIAVGVHVVVKLGEVRFRGGGLGSSAVVV